MNCEGIGSELLLQETANNTPKRTARAARLALAVRRPRRCLVFNHRLHPEQESSKRDVEPS